MKYDYTSVKNIYIICGKTDKRKGIDGLATLIQDSFELEPYGESFFLFAGWSKDPFKCLYFDGDGFAKLYKRLDNGKLQWPKDEKEVRNLSQQELRWLREGLVIQPSSKVVNDVANASSTNENQYEKLIRLLEEQLAHSNRQNKDLSKQIEALTHQVRH